jgi:ABC-2 type transport system permease protein
VTSIAAVGRRPARKYLMLLRTCLIESATHRTQNLVWVLVGALPTLFAIVAWLAVYGGRRQIAGYTRSDIITYYLVVGIAWYVIGGRINVQVARAIKDGTLAQHLLKPYAALSYYILGEQTWKIISLILALPVYVVLLILFRHDIHLAETPLRTGLAGLATLLSATMFIIIEVSIGMLAFWTTNTRNLFEVYDLFLYLASGELVPLALFPSWLHTALTGLPFRYTFSFPIEVFLGKLGDAGVAAGFLWQAGWLLVLLAVARTLWVRGLRRYNATGM